MKIDFTKPVKTIDGRAVRIICTDGPRPDYPIIGIVDGDIMTWTREGYFNVSGTVCADLVQALPRVKRTLWINLYSKDTGVHESKKMANDRRTETCLACVKVDIDVEEGSGL